MSYGTKYQVTWKDQVFGNTKIVYIQERDYSGSITTVMADQDPVVMAWDPDSDTKYPLLKASSADIFLVSPSRQYFINLFTSDKFKYRVQIYENGSSKWMGFLQPDLYSEAYDNKNYTVSIKAADGLGLLENIDFLDDDESYYTGNKKDLDIILICLNKLPLYLNLYTAIDVYETRMDSDADSDDPLTQAYTNCDIFKGMTCSEVLREILKPYGAMIYQQDKDWYVVRMNQFSKSSFIARKYNSSGTYLSYSTITPGIALTNESASIATRNIMVMGSTNLDIIPGMKELNIKHDYGLLDNILPGGDFHIDQFSKSNDNYINDYWTRYNGDNNNVLGYSYDNSDNLFVNLNGLCDSYSINIINDSEYIQHLLPINEDTKRILFSFEMMFYGYKRNSSSPAASVMSVDTYIQIQLGSYYLTYEGWKDQSTIATADRYLKSTKSFRYNAEYETFTIEADEIPISGTMIIRIFQATDDSQDIDNKFEIRVKKVGIQLFDETILKDKIELQTIVDANNNYIPDTIEIMAADVPDITNAKIIYDNAKYLSDGSPTIQWQEKGSEFIEPLIVTLARMITDQYLRPSIKYDALIRDAHVKIGSVISDNWDNIKFMVQSIKSINESTNDCQCILMEILESTELQTESEENILTETGETILI